jgi:hypothetical protein
MNMASVGESIATTTGGHPERTVVRKGAGADTKDPWGLTPAHGSFVGKPTHGSINLRAQDDLDKV